MVYRECVWRDGNFLSTLHKTDYGERTSSLTVGLREEYLMLCWLMRRRPWSNFSLGEVWVLDTLIMSLKCNKMFFFLFSSSSSSWHFFQCGSTLFLSSERTIERPCSRHVCGHVVVNMEGVKPRCRTAAPACARGCVVRWALGWKISESFYAPFVVPGSPPWVPLLVFVL